MQDCLSYARQAYCLSSAQSSGFQGHWIFGVPVNISGSSARHHNLLPLWSCQNGSDPLLSNSEEPQVKWVALTDMH